MGPKTRNQLGSASSVMAMDPHETWTCEVCSKLFNDDRDRLVQCEYCEKCYCSECLKLSNDNYDVFQIPSIHWFCPKCEEKVMKSIKTDKDIETRCAKFLQVMESRMAKLEADMAAKVDIKRVESIVEEKIMHANIQPGQTSAIESEESMNRKIAEFRDSDSRVNNLIVYGVAELDNKDSIIRKKQDTDFVRELADYIAVDSSLIQNVVRIGIRRDDGNATDKGDLQGTSGGNSDMSVTQNVASTGFPMAGAANSTIDKTRPRPIKVMMKDAESRKTFLRNLPKLRHVQPNSKFAEVSVSQDMTRDERELHKSKVSEAKEKNEKEKGNFRHVVRGPPWNKRIVRLRAE
jgi:hypothetical protein